MADNQTLPEKKAPATSRDMRIFAFKAYARIAARKHGVVVPDNVYFEDLSDEDLEQDLALVRDLAHLPPA